MATTAQTSDLEGILAGNADGELVLTPDGKLRLRPLTGFERFRKGLGFGPASSKAILGYMNNHQKDLEKIALSLKNDPQKLAATQNRMNALFQKIDPLKTPDLYLYVNQNWMGELPDAVRQQPLNKLRIPGTHDSAAYQLKLNKTPPGKWKWAAILVNATRFFGVKKLVEDFTITQNYSIKKQLELGARYLDFRVMYNSSDRKYYLSHSFACLELDDALKQIKEFMHAHPKEVVFLQIETDERHQANFQSEQTDALLKKLNDQLGNIAVKRDPNSNTDPSINTVGKMSLQELENKNQRMIIGVHDIGKNVMSRDHSDIVWDSNLNNEGWLKANTVDIGANNMAKKMSQAQGDQTSSMHCVAASLTPEAEEIKREAVRRFLPITQLFDKYRHRVPTVRERGQKMNTQIQRQLNQSKEYRGVVYCDAPDRSSAFDDIIRSNKN